MKYWQAVNHALTEEMERDETVIVLGQNVARPGGTFGSTRGLLKRFGELRVLDTPISEQAAVGAAVGAALFGLRPVVEIVFSDFLLIASDPVVNQAAKFGYFSGGQASVPMVVKTGIGVDSGLGGQHTQALEAWYAHVPGLKVVWPSTPSDAAGLLRAAIRDDGPVVFLESVGRYRDVDAGERVDEVVSIGTARILREGDDVTLVSYGTAVEDCLEAADALAADRIGAEVIDLRSIQPWDRDAVFGSVRRTGRLVVVHHATRSFGIGAEVASEAAEACFDYLDAPVLRIGSPRVPMPQVTGLERLLRPGPNDVAAAARDLVRGDR